MDPSQVARLDQAGTELQRHLAPLLGGYYQALKANKIPADLAKELVMALQEHFTTTPEVDS